MSGPIHVCVADDRPINRNLMAHKLAKVHPSWKVLLCDTAEQVLEEWEHVELLIIDNDFGAGKLRGSEAIRLIRQREHGEDLLIALWSAEQNQDDPGANFMWEKTVGPDTMAHDLGQLLGREQLVCADGVATNRC